MKKVIITILFALSAISVSAQYYITMNLIDGSELYGYIAEQIPGKKFVFNATKSYIYLNGDNVLSATPHIVDAKDLSDSWKRWAEENSALDCNNGSCGLLLYDICLKNNTIRSVRIFERGATYRYLSYEETKYELDWDQIKTVSCERRPKKLLSGIDRIYKLSDGVQITGQYVKEIPGETIGIFTDNGIIETFKSDKIVKESMVRLNPDQSLVEQSELVDVLTLTNGTTVEGIITERNYSTKTEEEYLLIMQNDNLTQSLKLSDIHKYGKKPNLEYKPEYDIELAKGEIALFRNVIPEFTNIQRSDDGLSATTDSIATRITSDIAKNVCFEARFDNDNVARSLVIIAATQTTDVKTSKKNALELTKYSVKYSDIVNMAISCQSLSINKNGIYKITYSLPSEGVYFIYNPADKSVRVIEVIH